MNIDRRGPGEPLKAVEKILQRIGRGTCSEIERWGNLPYESSRAPVRAMHTAGLLHICDWHRPPGVSVWSAVYALGKGEDAPRPLPKPKNPKRRAVCAGEDERTPGLPMDYPVKSVFVGGVNPWVGGVA